MKTKVLVTVMTYPHPSTSYKELVCVAGVTEKGEWVRLYPVDYRYRPKHQRFKKYQWIEVELEPRESAKDNRKESRRPKLESIRMLGEPLPAGKWKERKEIIGQLPVRTRDELKALYDSQKVSLGLVKPSRVLDVEIKRSSGKWKPKQQQVLDQIDLFSGQPKKLKKLPYDFRYVFECEDSKKPHKALITDWELGVLWLKERERLRSEKAAAESVKKKFLDQLCSPKRDTHFFMGTVFPYNTWLVIGVFWPPLDPQGTLF